MAQEKIYDIPLKDIDIDEDNVRKENPQERIDELAKSIELHGQMQPIMLRGVYNKPPYKVIVGQRRFLAHQLLGKRNIKSRFVGNIQDLKATLISLAENMQRVDLNHADKAESITKLFLHFNKSAKKVSEALGISVRTINEYVKLDTLATPKIKTLLKQGRISKQDAKRAITAAQGNKNKSDELIDVITKLSSGDEKNRLVNFAITNPVASVHELKAEAKKPKVEEAIMLKLPTEIRIAARKACEDLALEIDVLALKALSSWLKDNSYL